MRTGTVGNMQKRAWGYYGFPQSLTLPVGEVRYVVGWLSDQMTRLDWDVLIDGSEEWTVDLNSENTPPDKRVPPISTTRDDGEQDLTEASRELLELVGWNDTTIRAVTTNLFVAGEGDYIKDGDTWRVVSVVENKRKEIIDAAKERVPFIWPHPADPKKPDAPLFSVLEVLEELEWLNLQARTQSKQRVMFSGILATADQLEGPNDTTFWDVWNDTLSARAINPDDMSPVRLEGPLDVIKDGIQWTMPPFGYDQTIDRRVIAGIQRLAYGLPVPPKVLLGAQNQSRAVAYQEEESAYREHIEPQAWMVGQVPEDALTKVLEAVKSVEVKPNPAQMLARKQSVSDAFEMYDRIEISGDYLREIVGVPDDAAPSPEERTERQASQSSPNKATSDPANDAADEPVTAAATDDLSTLLADIDAHLSSELAGVTVMATDRARQRLGAAARSNETVRSNPDLKGLSSAQVAVKLGVDGLTAAGVRVVDLIAEPIDSASRWWVKRIGEAWEQASTLVPGWSGKGDWVDESVSELDRALSSHIMHTLGEPDLSPLQAGDIRAVVDAAAGG